MERRRLAIGVIFALVVTSIAAAAPTTPALTVGAELQGGSYLFMPDLSFRVMTGLPVAGNRFALVPSVGVTYLFAPMTGVSGGWYVPAGLELRFPQEQLGIVLRNLFSLTNPWGEGAATAGIEAYLPVATVGKSVFGLSVEVGAAVFWSTTVRPLFLINLAPGLRYEYRAKSYP